MARYRLILGNQNYSSWSLRAWLPLQHFKLEFEIEKISLFTPQGDQALARASSSRKVPVLLDEQVAGQPIWDSLAISEHLAQEHPKCAMWPQDPKARAFARSIACELHSSFQALRTQMPMNCKRQGIDAKPNQACLDDLQRIYDICQIGRTQFSKYGDYLAGEFSLADTMFAPVVWRLATYLQELPPLVAKYCETMRALPAMQAWEAQALAEAHCIEKYDKVGVARTASL